MTQFTPVTIKIMREMEAGETTRQMNLRIRRQRKSVVTNQDFAATDNKFQKACEKGHVSATSRQASKYRNKKGAAYNAARYGGNISRCPAKSAEVVGCR